MCTIQAVGPHVSLLLLLCSATIVSAQSTWYYTVSYLTGSSTSPIYVPGSTSLPLTVAFLSYNSAASSGTCPVANTDQINCSISSTSPSGISAKFTFSYSTNTQYFTTATNGGCTIYLNAQPTCFTDTASYSGTTQQMTINPTMYDASCTAATATSNSQAVTVYVDCSQYTSTSTSTTSTSTSTSTSTTTSTTTTTTQYTTTTSFVQSPAGIAVVVIGSLAGLAAVIAAIYGFYKCCRNPIEPVKRVQEVREIRTVYPTAEKPEALNSPRTAVYYSNSGYSQGTPVPAFGRGLPSVNL